jgi:hypothetical protein
VEIIQHRRLARRLSKSFLEDAETGLTLGAGLHIDLQGYEFRFDYGWADYGRLDNAPIYTIGIGTAFDFYTR